MLKTTVGDDEDERELIIFKVFARENETDEIFELGWFCASNVYGCKARSTSFDSVKKVLEALGLVHETCTDSSCVDPFVRTE